jgi:hypothetical protein
MTWGVKQDLAPGQESAMRGRERGNLGVHQVICNIGRNDYLEKKDKANV